MIKRIKTQAKKSQQLNRNYLTKLKKLIKTGLYSPKSETLGPRQKREINRIWKKNADNLDNSKTIFVKIPKGEKLRSQKILKKAKGLKMDISSTGIFVPKNGQRRATVLYNYKTHEAEIKLTGKVKWGKNKGKRIEQRIPLVSIDEIGKLENNLLNSAERFGKLSENEALQFRVIQDGREGLSHEIFTDPNKLMDYLKFRYEKTPVNRIMFYRHIIIEKVTITEWLSERQMQRKPKKRKVNKTGRN